MNHAEILCPGASRRILGPHDQVQMANVVSRLSCHAGADPLLVGLAGRRAEYERRARCPVRLHQRGTQRDWPCRRVDSGMDAEVRGPLSIPDEAMVWQRGVEIS